MVVRAPLPEQTRLSDQQVDRMFKALADATRRDIVRQVLQGEQSVSTLAHRYPMTFAAVQKHVVVLEGAGLVTKRRHGREQLVGGNVEAIRAVSAQLDALEALWRGRIERISEIVHEPSTPQKGTRR